MFNCNRDTRKCVTVIRVLQHTLPILFIFFCVKLGSTWLYLFCSYIGGWLFHVLAEAVFCCILVRIILH